MGIILVFKNSQLSENSERIITNGYGMIDFINEEYKINASNINRDHLFSNITTNFKGTNVTIGVYHKLKNICKAAVVFCSSTLCFYSDCSDERGYIECNVQPPLQGSYDEFTYTYTLVMILPYYHVIGSGLIYFEENFMAPIDTDLNFISTSVKTLPDYLKNSSLHTFKTNSMSTNGRMTKYFNWKYSEKYDTAVFDRQIEVIGDMEDLIFRNKAIVSGPRYSSITEFIKNFKPRQKLNMYMFAFEKAPRVEEILKLRKFLPTLGQKLNSTMIVVPPRSDNNTETENILLLRHFLKTQRFQMLDLFEFSFLPHEDNYGSIIDSYIIPKLCGNTVVLPLIHS